MPLYQARAYCLIPRLSQVMLIALALVWAAGYLPAYANGRATLVVSQEQGPYLIDVSILPAQAIVNNTHVSILLRSVSDNTVLTEAEVNLSQRQSSYCSREGQPESPKNFPENFRTYSASAPASPASSVGELRPVTRSQVQMPTARIATTMAAIKIQLILAPPCRTSRGTCIVSSPKAEETRTVTNHSPAGAVGRLALGQVLV